MKILVFNTGDKNIGSYYQPGIQLPQSCLVQVSDNYPDFCKAVQACLSGQGIIVFYVKKQQDLDCLRSVMTEYSDLKLIVSIPDDQTLIHRALALYPRFIDFQNDGNHQNIIAVLNKMIGNETKQIK